MYPITYSKLAQKAEELFELTIDNVPVLSIPDLYAGKICAALDRQHPRDLFDISLLYKNEGLTEEIRHAFVIYLASSPRPIHELLEFETIDKLPALQWKISNIEKIELSKKKLMLAKLEKVLFG